MPSRLPTDLPEFHLGYQVHNVTCNEPPAVVQDPGTANTKTLSFDVMLLRERLYNNAGTDFELDLMSKQAEDPVKLLPCALPWWALPSEPGQQKATGACSPDEASQLIADDIKAEGGGDAVGSDDKEVTVDVDSDGPTLAKRSKSVLQELAITSKLEETSGDVVLENGEQAEAVVEECVCDVGVRHARGRKWRTIWAACMTYVSSKACCSRPAVCE
jgi:hypothetical protein